MRIDALTIKVKVGEEGFWNTVFEYDVPAEWGQELYNYFILGFPPGSFHTAMFANNLADAAARSHPANTWDAIMVTMRWLNNVAPRYVRNNVSVSSWGSYENVRDWLALTQEERRTICENRRFVLTEEELTWKLLKESENVSS